ncbi:MAG: ribonuclease P protein component [Legionellaceae bacterium]|nr:ribonuclease P protein component [Legionellaceae bacterium]
MLHKNDFDYVFAQASNIYSPSFVVLYRQGQADRARLGLVIAKRKVRKACQRNRIKRIIRESFRLQHLPSCDIIVLPKHHTDSLDNQTLFNNLDKVWSKLNAIGAA